MRLVGAAIDSADILHFSASGVSSADIGTSPAFDSWIFWICSSTVGAFPTRRSAHSVQGGQADEADNQAEPEADQPARRMAAGVVQMPQVMPCVHRPLDK